MQRDRETQTNTPRQAGQGRGRLYVPFPLFPRCLVVFFVLVGSLCGASMRPLWCLCLVSVSPLCVLASVSPLWCQAGSQTGEGEAMRRGVSMGARWEASAGPLCGLAWGLKERTRGREERAWDDSYPSPCFCPVPSALCLLPGALCPAGVCPSLKKETDRKREGQGKDGGATCALCPSLSVGPLSPSAALGAEAAHTWESTWFWSLQKTPKQHTPANPHGFRAPRRRRCSNNP